MKRILAVSLLALSCSGCAVPVLIGAQTAAMVTDHFDPGLGIASAEVTANTIIVNALDPYLTPAAHTFFCNKYAASSCARH